MKTLILFACLAPFFAQAAAGPSVSGGGAPAPLAVVIQGHLVDGAFDQRGHAIAAKLANSHLQQGLAEVITKRAEDQFPDRTYMCIEYKSYEDANNASDQFKDALNAHPSLEVVRNSYCR